MTDTVSTLIEAVTRKCATPCAVSCCLPVKIESEANLREHHFSRARRSKRQRGVVRLMLGNHERMLRTWPAWRVTLHRIGKRKLDTDNLAGGFKHVRDEIAAICGVNDNDERRYEWVYTQATGKEYVAWVKIEKAAGAA